MPNELSKKTYPDGTEVYYRDDTAREQIANVASGISPISKKSITANTENEFFAQVFADLKADTETYATSSVYAAIRRIYIWTGNNSFIVDAARLSGKWLDALVYAWDRLYIFEYNCYDNVISTKKTATLT